MEGVARFRVNVYQQRGTMGLVLRIIPLQVMSLEELGMPPGIADLAKIDRPDVVRDRGEFRRRAVGTAGLQGAEAKIPVAGPA